MNASGRLAKSTPGCWGVAQPDPGSGVAAGAGRGGLCGCADARPNRVLQGSRELGGAGLQQRWEQELVVDAAGSGGGGDESPLRLNDTPVLTSGAQRAGRSPGPGRASAWSLSLRLKGQWRKGESKQPTSSCCFSKPDVLPLWAS